MSASSELSEFKAGMVLMTDVDRVVKEMVVDDGDSAFEMQPLRVKIAPGGIGQFLIGDETVKTFTAVVPISQKVRGYWPEPGGDKSPICASADGRSGVFESEMDAERFKAATSTALPHPGVVALMENRPALSSYECASCPLNLWGSEHQRRGGRGKACKEMRRLLVIIDDRALPAVMSLPPTSIRGWDTYCSLLQSKNTAYFAVKTKFELDTAKSASGETYNFIKFSVQQNLTFIESVEHVRAIREQYRGLVSQMPVGIE